jgi:hypothetical protein
MFQWLKQLLNSIERYKTFKVDHRAVDWTESDEHNFALAMRRPWGIKFLTVIAQRADNACRNSVLSGNPQYMAGMASGYWQAVADVMQMADLNISDISKMSDSMDLVVKEQSQNQSSTVDAKQKEYQWKP